MPSLTLGARAANAVHPAGGFRATLRRVLGVLRTVIGAPDYDRYVQHMRAHHPECCLASRDEFMQQRLESRYSRPGARCC
jgi:uncharacterized short protein YbdD (DUF466 family)